MINKTTCMSYLCYIFSEVVTKVTYTVTGNGVELSSDKAEQYFIKALKKLHLKEYNGVVKKMELQVQNKVSIVLLFINWAPLFADVYCYFHAVNFMPFSR
jgi:hypothetical protein